MQKKVLFFLWGLCLMALIVTRLRSQGPRWEMRRPSTGQAVKGRGGAE